MRDRIVDEWLAGIAGRRFGGRAVTAQLVDLAEHGLVRIRWADQARTCVVTRHDGPGPDPAGGAGATALLDELFNGGRREVHLRPHSHSGVTTALARHARRRTKRAGYWRTARCGTLTASGAATSSTGSGTPAGPTVARRHRLDGPWPSTRDSGGQAANGPLAVRAARPAGPGGA